MEVFSTVQFITAAFSLLVAFIAVLGAARAGVLKKFKFGSFEIEAAQNELKEGREIVKKELSLPGREGIPFEAEQLAHYYAQVLSQSKVSFWFSLVFASLGFGIIVLSAMFYTNERFGTTVASFVAGTIIDAVSALFFVQAKNAQKSMAEFFDKLRGDRQQLESRRLCDVLKDHRAKDALTVQLALFLSGVPDAKAIGEGIISQCLSFHTSNDDKAQ